MGFRHDGTYEHVGYKHGAWHPVGWWQLLLDGPDDGDPPPPRPLAEIASTEAFRAALDAGLAYLKA